MSDTPIADRTIGDYLQALASSAPAPGGGSVAGLVGALSAALGQMVISLTDRRSDPHPELDTVRDALERFRDMCLAGSQTDEHAYSGYVSATKLPKGTKEEKAARRDAMQAGLLDSANAPLALAGTSLEILGDLETVIQNGSSHVLSDAEIATTLAYASVTVGLVNVRVNIPLIKDTDRARSLTAAADDIEHRATEALRRCRKRLQERRQASKVG